MGVTVQVRNLDESAGEKLRAAAASRGLSLSAYLRQELTRLADEVDARNRLGGPIPALAGIDTQEVVAMIHDDRKGR
ncbi:hypothetical protein [Glaciihabitans sp. UYNi722]|uniref:FitA-like ribbon-helix-helix domain-containing protein n=1 Tax=Glaciihabitans sp. UYNi722 TaxID=3156344 RepID=UPI00339B39B3